MSEVNIFEYASRNALRFPSKIGGITVEQLWDLPLLSSRANGPCLNDTAKTINNSLRTASEDSFVKRAENTTNLRPLEVSLEIVKHIIKTKEEENAAALEFSKKRARRAKLVEALENRETADLSSMSKEDILKELESL